MNVDYFFSSPQGDIHADPKVLASPFVLSPTEQHPFVTLGNYFETLKKFACSRPELAGAEHIKIISEKHGALYHIACISAVCNGQYKKFSVSSALSETGISCLSRDLKLLNRLNDTLGLPFLPTVYSSDIMPCGSSTASVDLLLVLAEWFDDHHEWHLTEDGLDIILWDHNRGNRLLGQQAAKALFKKTAEILTRYYDITTGNQIYPWHHAAGDFIVCDQNASIQLRLTTVRGYQTLTLPGTASDESPFVALLFFFLNLTIRNRLDRIEGIDAPVWSGRFVVPATIEGFFTAMQTMPAQNHAPVGMAEKLLSVLKTCNPAELATMCTPLINFYFEVSPSEAGFIAEHLDEHCLFLQQEIANFTLEP